MLYGAQNGILGHVSFAVADPSQAESVGSIQVDLARTGSAVTSVNATVRVKPGDGGTATAGVDYNFTSAQAHWDAGETGVQSVFVPIVNDSESEPAETIVLEISATSSGLAEQSPSEVVLQIDASDAPAFELQLGALSTLESVGNLPLLVIRSGATYPAASVSWTTVSGGGLFGAVAGQDFTASGSTLTWSAGETNGKWIQIPVANDSTPEADEIFVVILYGPSGAGLSSPAATTVTILANDGAILFEDFETGSTARWSVPWP
ncbi:MAG: hypothetical protein K8H90_02925 [Thermoanaerobaculia bacterium]|nr:hypothetical protein [Thermoanaerobaculia bacterium]